MDLQNLPTILSMLIMLKKAMGNIGKFGTWLKTFLTILRNFSHWKTIFVEILYQKKEKLLLWMYKIKTKSWILCLHAARYLAFAQGIHDHSSSHVHLHSWSQYMGVLGED